MSTVAAAVIGGFLALAGVVVTGALTLVVAAWRTRGERLIARDRAVAQGLTVAMDRLSQLHSTYQEISLVSSFDADDASRMSSAESAFLGACDQTADDSLDDAAQRYIEKGRAHAARSPDLPALEEEKQWSALRAVLRGRLRSVTRT